MIARARDRRSFLRRSLALAAALPLAACDRFAESPRARPILKAGEDANLYVQRLLARPSNLAREYPEAAISSYFKPNGSTDPDSQAYRVMASEHFASYRLKVEGLVTKDLSLSLHDLRAMPRRTQITRHDCVEGWSCIGKWTGVPLADVLRGAGLKPQARYVAFHCADRMDDSDAGSLSPAYYYESIDLDDAFHPQTILADEMNGKPLPVEHGAPLRLRVERQLGYKMAKYVMRIELVETLEGIGNGKGGYWEDNGYQWYAGI